MNTDEMLTLYDEQERKNSIHPSYRWETDRGWVRHISHDPTRLSFIIYSKLTAANADQIIQEQIEWDGSF